MQQYELRLFTSSTYSVQVIKNAVEEAGRKAVLIPGDLEDEEHIK